MRFPVAAASSASSSSSSSSLSPATAALLPIVALLAICGSTPVSAHYDAPNAAPTVVRPLGDVPYAATTAAPMIGREAAKRLRRQASVGDQTCGWFQSSAALPWTCEESHECATNAQKVVACVPSSVSSPPASYFYSECRDYSQAQWQSCTSLKEGVGCCTATDLPACGLIVWKEDPGRSMWRCYDRPTTITLAETPPPGALLSTADPNATTATTDTSKASSAATATGTESPAAGLDNSAPDNGSSDNDDGADGLAGNSGPGGGSQENSGGPNVGAIVGGAVGGGAALFAIIAVAFFVVRRRKQKKEAEAAAAAASKDPDSPYEPKSFDPHSGNPEGTTAPDGAPLPTGRPSIASFGPLENLPYPTVSLVPPSATTLVPGSPAKAAQQNGSYHTSSAGVSEISLADQKPPLPIPSPILDDSSSEDEAAYDPEHSAYVRQSMYSRCISPTNEILDLESAPETSDDLGALAEIVANRY